MLNETIKFAIALIGFIILCLFIMKYIVWGILIFLAAISILHGLAEWVNTFSTEKKGTRVFIWFMNHRFLLEVMDLALGYITGGTGTITGITFAITTGLIASVFRICNHKWKHWRQITLIEDIYRDGLPKSWKSEESLSSIIFRPNQPKQKSKITLTWK